MMKTKVIIVGCVVTLLTTACIAPQGKDKARFEEEVVKTVLVSETSAVRDFLKPRKGDELEIKTDWADQDFYVVVFPKHMSKAVLFDLGAVKKKAQISVENYGYGILQTNGNWLLTHVDESGRVFESHGGVWTYNKIAEIISLCAKRRNFLEVRWQE